MISRKEDLFSSKTTRQRKQKLNEMKLFVKVKRVLFSIGVNVR
jgi:hypothetical protein